MKLNWDEILSTCCIDLCIQVHMVTFNRLGLHSLFSFSSKPNNGNYPNVRKPLHFISESVEWPQAHTKNGNNISLSLSLTLFLYLPFLSTLPKGWYWNPAPLCSILIILKTHQSNLLSTLGFLSAEKFAFFCATLIQAKCKA